MLNMWYDYIGVFEKVIENIGKLKFEVEIINEFVKRFDLDFFIKLEKEWVEYVKVYFEKVLNIKFEKYFVCVIKMEVLWEDKLFVIKSKKFEFEDEKMGVVVLFIDEERVLKN